MEATGTLTENRKRPRDDDCEDDPDPRTKRCPDPQTKRCGCGPDALESELGRDAWDSEQSSSSEGSCVASSPVHTPLCPHASSCRSNSLSPPPDDPRGSRLQGLHGDGGASYDHINRVLREAHFSSLQTRGGPGSS